jgi:hypothetical protein
VLFLKIGSLFFEGHFDAIEKALWRGYGEETETREGNVGMFLFPYKINHLLLCTKQKVTIMHIKKFIPDLIVIVVYALLSFAYFFPADIEGRELFQHDTVAGVGANHERLEFEQKTGKNTRWTNALFGGMPTYQTAPSYDSTNPLKWMQRIYQLFLPGYVGLMFIFMLGFFMLLRAFGIPAWLAGIGGVLWAFSSYFFILISAGHLWKFITLAYVPPTIAGIVWAYRGRLLTGGIVTALFVAIQILSNHIQMSYYFLIVILALFVAYAVQAFRSHTVPQFLRATGVLIVAAVIGVCINASNLYHTYTYSKESMRGKGELVETGHAATQQSTGLDRDYITQWSYGVGETLTFLVPNYKGSASVPLSESRTAMEKAELRYSNLYSSLTQYFGNQPGTSGPVYVGAFVLFLFLMGCFIVKGPMKWAIIAATLLSIMLSWGKNFMPLTDFFIDYVPMYNKFRTVSSILVVAEFTIPLLAIFALMKIMKEPQVLKQERRALYLSLLLTAGVALLLYMAPGALGNTFVPDNEMRMLQGALQQQGVPGTEITAIFGNLTEMRQAMVSSDALRSFFIIVIGTALLLAYGAGKLRSSLTLAGIAILCLVDMWGVNKRYLNDSQFVQPSKQQATMGKTPTDEAILQDTTPDYRVLNIAPNTFNENNTSYWHKSIGGYHPAKLRRYQEMIEHHISPEMDALYKEVAAAGGDMTKVDPDSFRVLNMLNTRYFIFPMQGGATTPVRNPYAYGNAWFVDHVNYVPNANAEIEALREIQPTQTAVVDARFKNQLKDATVLQHDSLASIRLLTYEPNRLVYETQNSHDGVALFSEIYYPDGWQFTIDGQPAELARADYILRAAYVPAGTHRLEMHFDPKSLHVTETIAYCALALLLLGVIGGVWVSKKRSH